MTALPLLTTCQAAAAGITRHVLTGPKWQQVVRGVWLPADQPVTREVMVAAARLVLPAEAVLCGLSAVTDYGVDVRASADVTVHAAFPGQIPRQRAGFELHQLALRTGEVEHHGQWYVTTPLRTVFDCARWLPIVEAVVVADAMAREKLFEVDELESFARSHPRVRSLWQVVEVARLVDPLAESPMESRLRLIIVFAFLPLPVSQLNVYSPAGRFVARLDLAFEEHKVAVEYDGAFHWEQRREDDRRRDALRALGWTVLVFSALDIYQRPAAVAAQVRAALERAGARKS